MPSFEHALTDAQIAAVINHERTSWGNSAPTVTPQSVAEIRKKEEKEEKEGHH
jgi:cytochrome c oxidase cbb3-type subunit 2